MGEKQKGFIIVPILIIFLLATLAVVYYKSFKSISVADIQSDFPPPKTVTQTINPNSNWKLYTNDKYSFSFKYPEDKYDLELQTIDSLDEKYNTDNIRLGFEYSRKYKPPEPVFGLSLTEKTQRHKDMGPISTFEIWIFNNPKKMSPDYWYRLYYYYPFSFGDSSDEENKPKFLITINGKDGLYAIIEKVYTNKMKNIYIQNGDYLFLIQVETDLDWDDKQGVKTEAPAIFETFKFTN